MDSIENERELGNRASAALADCRHRLFFLP
jgi:hypothetical protein